MRIRTLFEPVDLWKLFGPPLALVFPLAPVSPPTSSASPIFEAPFHVFKSGNSLSFVLQDVTNDGDPDLLTADVAGVRVSLGNGDGTFAPARTFATSGALGIARDLAVADLNGDGKPDVAALTFDDGVSTLLGTGDGSFVASAPTPTLPLAARVVTGEVNGDGNPDLMTTREVDGFAQVMLGNGDGTFSAMPAIDLGATQRGLVIVDIDGDGTSDLVYGNAITDRISKLLGRGDGTFGVRADLPVGSALAAVADLDADGIPDLVTSKSLTPAAISVVLGNGDGSFQPPTDYETGTWPFLIPTPTAVRDANGDGIADLLVGGCNGRITRVLLGYGDGTFRPSRDFGPWSCCYDLVADDVNRDGWIDIVAQSQGGFVVLVGDGDGRFGGVDHSFATARGLFSMVTGDFDGDGRLDVATGNAGTVSVLKARSDGTFDRRIDIDIPEIGGIVTSIAAGDLTGDGKMDLATANWGPSVALVPGRGDGTFAPARRYPLPGNVSWVVVADVSRDGKPDLVAVDYGSSEITVWSQTEATTLGPRTDYAVPGVPWSVAIGDLNGDEMPDLAVVAGTPQDQSNAVFVLLGNGDGAFGLPMQYSSGGLFSDDSIVPVVMADFNRDGNADLALGHRASGTVSVLLGAGDGTLGPPSQFEAGQDPFSLVVADVNADAVPDLVEPATYAPGAWVLLGVGDGTFAPPIGYGAGGEVFVLAVADVDLDRRPDLLAGFGRPNGSCAVSVLPNIGPLPHAPLGISHARTVTELDNHRDDAIAPALTLEVARRTAKEVTFAFSLPEARDLDVAIYDIAGRRVATLARSTVGPGSHTASWNISGLARGVYFCRLRAGSVTRSRSVLVLH